MKFINNLLKLGVTLTTLLGTADFKHTGDIWRCLLAELIGTLLLVVVLSGSCTAWLGSSPSTVQGALTVGFTVGVVIQAIGHVSGAHINPAVTLGFVVTGHIRILKSVLYIIVQIIGAVMGSLLTKYITPGRVQGNLCVTTINPALTRAQGVFVEGIGTFVLMLVLQSVSDERRKHLGNATPLAAALAAISVILATGAYTGGSINPARSIGPAFATGNIQDLWVYCLGPVLGAVVASCIYTLAFKENKQ